MGVEDSFIKCCSATGYTSAVIAKFKTALQLAEEVLQGQQRKSGEASVEHNLRVGLILVENKAAPEVVLAGILHGLPLHEKIPSLFGMEVRSLTLGVEEIKQIKSKNKLLEAEALRRIILTTLKDPRIIFIELANKLDNLRTILALPKDEQQRIAQEILDIYAPLASRLGIEKIKVELENLAFKVLNSRKYQEIADYLAESSEQREENIRQTIAKIKELSAGKVEIISITGRPKHIYSIYKKIVQRKVDLREQYDLLGLRIIVPEIKDCYLMLGLLHEHFEPVEGRLKDYIAKPKPNLYRSLHTGLRLSTGRMAEVQIRTPEMDEIAEEGVASHWQYKGMKSETFFEKKIGWLKKILQFQKDSENKELLEAAKIDLFGDEIYCYTPKGDVKELPLDASVLDFAYEVHEEVGNHAIGGRVNGKFAPLSHKLQAGDVVDIMTNKNQRPHRGWLKLVRSPKAQQRIRKMLKEHEKLALMHYRFLKSVVKEDIGVLVSSPEIPAAVCTLARCCSPLPGELIAGLATKRRVVSVHRKDCRAALKEEERWIKVAWKDTFNQKIRFFVQAEERSGLLADLLHTIASAHFEVKEAKAKMIDVGLEECSFLIVPRDLQELKVLIQRVQKVKGVKKVYFE